MKEEMKEKTLEHRESLWDIAVRLCSEENIHSSSNQPQERTMIVMGSKGVGKSQLIYRLLDRNEAPKPTLALEYSFGRKSGRSLVKDTCHIWELGGGLVFLSLLPPLLAPLQSNKPVSVVLLLDLSAPRQLWPTLESLLNALTSAATEFRKSNPLAYKELVDAAWMRVGRDHPDAACLDPFPLPLGIVGGKYDLFKDMDPENKKIVCRSLRSVALILGASLHFYSAKDTSLVKKGKELMSQGGFGTSAPKGISQDYNLPLAIPVGADSLQQIGLNLGQETSAASSLERIKHIYTTHFPPEQVVSTIPDDPAQNPSFREPIIDSLRSQKDTELERLQTEIERRLKIANAI